MEENKEEMEERYDSTQDALADWLALFTNINYAVGNPELAVAARIIARLKPKADRRVPMMAVTIQQGKHILLYNPDWAGQTTYTEFAATLVHEAYHIHLRDIPRYFRRIARFPATEQGLVQRILNIALDVANNELQAQRMPHMKYGKTGYWAMASNTQVPPRESSDVYFEILYARAKDQQKELEEGVAMALSMLLPTGPKDGDDNGSGGDRGDAQGDAQGESAEGADGKGEEKDKPRDPKIEAMAKAIAQHIKDNAHNWMEAKGEGEISAAEMSAEELEAMAAQLEDDAKRHVVQALKAQQKTCGRLPQHLQQELDALLTPSTIPWTRVLRNLLASNVQTYRESTSRMFAKKRYHLFALGRDGQVVPMAAPAPVYPGVQVHRTYTILWALDTSGSMSTKDVEEGLSELQGLIRADPNVHVIVVQCDTHISDVSILTPDESLDRYIKDVGRTSAGGTEFDKPFELERFIRTKEVPYGIQDKHLDVVRDYERVDLVVYHTDGYGQAPKLKDPPPCPIYWCLTENGVTPQNLAGMHAQVIRR